MAHGKKGDILEFFDICTIVVDHKTDIADNYHMKGQWCHGPVFHTPNSLALRERAGIKIGQTKNGFPDSATKQKYYGNCLLLLHINYTRWQM